MNYKNLVNKFTLGELDPRFLAEVDYEGYRKGARKFRNVFCNNTGGAQRRFGTQYNDTISDGVSLLQDDTKAKLIAFEFLDSEIYWIVLRSNAVGGVAADIYLDDALQTTVDPVGTYLDTQIRQLRWVEFVNGLLLLHESYPPCILQRIAANNWSSQDAVFSFYPGEDFSILDNPFSNYTNNGTTFTPNAVNATTITASTAVFTSNHSGIPPNGGGLFFGNGGIFRIVSVNAGGTVATGYAVEDFIDTGAILGSECVLAERAWGDGSVIGSAPAGNARGYPRHGNFFQGRLVLGGSIASPGTAYASDVKAFFTFDNSSGSPEQAWDVEAGVTGTDTINEIVSSKSLVLITNKGTSATNILVETATTPANVFLNTQGEEGGRNMDATILNNQIVYADVAGNTIWSMLYDVPDTGYSIYNLSSLASHLIRIPRWSGVFNPDVIDGRFYLLVNSDGTMAILNSIIEENIKAWSLAETTGSFVDVACVQNQAKVLVRRKLGTGLLAEGAVQAFYTVDSTWHTFRDFTDVVNSETPFNIFDFNGDYILIGSEIPFSLATIVFAQASIMNENLTFEFLTNTGAWEFFNLLADTTLGFTTDGDITWDTDLQNWLAQPILQTKTVYGDYPVLYWMRIRRNQPAAGSTPILTSFKINTANIINLERLSFDLVMDATLNTTSNGLGLVTGLDNFVGQNVFVFGAGFPIDTYLVPTTGEITIPVLNADVVIGLDYKPLIVPMPVVAFMQDGPTVYEPQKIKYIYIDFFDSLGITIEGQNVPQISPGDFMTQLIPVPTSDFYQVPTYAGWDPRAEIVVTQSYPAKMIIRGLSYSVEVQ